MQLDTAFHLAVAEGGFNFATEIARYGYCVTQFLGQHGRARDWARRMVDFYMASFGRYSFTLPAYWRFTKVPSRFMTEELAAQAFSWLGMRVDRSSTLDDEPTSQDLRTLYDATFGPGQPIAFKCTGRPLTLANVDGSCISGLPVSGRNDGQGAARASKSARRRARARARAAGGGTASSEPPEEGADVDVLYDRGAVMS